MISHRESVKLEICLKLLHGVCELGYMFQFGGDLIFNGSSIATLWSVILSAHLLGWSFLLEDQTHHSRL